MDVILAFTQGQMQGKNLTCGLSPLEELQNFQKRLGQSDFTSKKNRDKASIFVNSVLQLYDELKLSAGKQVVQYL